MGTWLVVISAVCGCHAICYMHPVYMYMLYVSVQSIDESLARNKTIKLHLSLLYSYFTAADSSFTDLLVCID